MTASFGTNAAATVKNWGQEVYQEYLRGNTLSFLMGSTSDAPIQIMDKSGEKGDTFKYHLRGKIAGGVFGDGQLTGNEQPLNVFTDEVLVRTVRNAARIDDWYISSENTRLDLAMEARTALTDWLKETIRDDVLYALTGTPTSTAQLANSALYPVSRTTGRTTTRALYGISASNYNATEATAFGNIDPVNDKMTLEVIRVSRDLATSGTNPIRPAKFKMLNGAPSEGFVMLVNPRQARDLEQDATFRNSRLWKTQDDNAGLFRGAFYKGTVHGVDVYSIPEVPVLTGVGTGSTDVAQAVLLGAQAATAVYRQRPDFQVRKEDDYGNTWGLGVAEVRGEKRNVFNSTNFSCVHVFTSAVAD
jgi:N4-gp56 family major capsid protein